MAIYIGGVVPLWVIAIGALTTMALVAAIIIRFRPKQLAARWADNQLLEKRFILPPKHHSLPQPPKLVRYEEDLSALQFTDQGRLYEIAVIHDQELEQQLQGSDIPVIDRRDR